MKNIVILFLLYLFFVPVLLNAYDNHRYIYIDGDNQFTSERGLRSGNGSKESPFVIGDYEISAPEEYAGITINNTKKYFIIRKCYIHGNGNSIGISLYNSKNAKIEDTILENMDTGINNKYESLIQQISKCSISNCNVGIRNVNSIKSIIYSRFQNCRVGIINEYTDIANNVVDMFKVTSNIEAIEHCDILNCGNGISNAGSIKTISQCTISECGTGVSNEYSNFYIPTIQKITDNNIYKNQFGVNNKSGLYYGVGYYMPNIDNSDSTINARNNWWGSPGGPGGVGPGTGDKISEKVKYEPWEETKIENIGVNYQ